MLGSLHTSDIRRFIPRLVFLDKQIRVNKSTLPLFKLDWDSVDQYKADEYATWKEEYWKKTNTGESARPGTLPPEYDEKVKNLTFAISNSYKREIMHYATLFVAERTRDRKFDTCVRDRCLRTSVAAMQTAFYLLKDCLYHEEVNGWYRGPYKELYLYAMQYKFWRLFTGSGLVAEFAELGRLRYIALALDGQQKLDSVIERSVEGQTEVSADQQIYLQFLEDIKRWEEEQKTFWAHTVIEQEMVDTTATQT